jgi:hypothetical protein
VESSLYIDWYRYPLETAWRLDLVPVPPVPAGVLDAIEDDEFVHRTDKIETALPGQIARLNDGDGLAHAGFPVILSLSLGFKPVNAIVYCWPL